nr:peptidyl-prolyl cis-trans isomerase FKBP43-like [Tanacetum cinerariifolium]
MFQVHPQFDSTFKHNSQLLFGRLSGGFYLKPNEPYTLHYQDDAAPKRLRITQATLADATRHSPARSIVRCSVGDKSAIAICSLSVRDLICCKLELEFEESHDVVFSVMGPRGVYLAGYLITPAPTAHLLSFDHTGQGKLTMEIAGCSDRDLHEDEPDFSKTCLIEESQNKDIEHSDKNIKSGKHLLKCIKDENKEGKIIINFDRKVRDAIERKKKKNKKNKKRKVGTLEATATEDVNDFSDGKVGSDSRITEDNGYPDACERNDERLKERKKNKKKRKHTLDYHKNHSMGDMIRNNNFENRRPTTGNVEFGFCGKVKSNRRDK